MLVNKYIIFLHGRYTSKDLSFYKKLIAKQTTIAVDGGYSFFKKSKLIPDILLGDFDSLNLKQAKIPTSVELIQHPSIKDKTDSQLAIEYAIGNKADAIEIVMPEIGEPDHFLGNLLLLFSTQVLSYVKSGGKIRFISREYEYYLLSDNQVTIKNSLGSIVSLLPFSKAVIYNCRGTKYKAKDLRIKKGESVALRNQITAQRAVFRLLGQGLLIVATDR